MKKLQRVVLAALFAVMLALGAFGVAACSTTDSTPKSEYTMTFMVGTMVYDSVTTTEGSSYQTKEAPVRVNNVFEGWSQTENGAVEELPAKMPAENRTYYAIFSAQYTLSLNAGVGVIPDEQKTIAVKVGEELYTKLSSITPTLADGDAAFDGWYLRGTDKISESAALTMPNGNVEVVAKYSVAYTVNVYKEIDFNSDDYPTDPTTTVEGTALVGDRVSGLPAYPGFRYDNDKDNTAITAALDKNSAQNVLSVYYEYIAYDAEFSVNLPADVEFEGDPQTIACGYQLTNEAPECGYTADGYRFCGWSNTPDGDVDYYPGDEFSIDRATIFYAKWAKGLTELTGLSSDRIYIMGKVEDPSVTVAYLERVGLRDILGTYDTTTHVFTFKSVIAEDGDVLLRGIADTTNNTFTYLNNDNTTAYTLLGAEGDNVPTVTLNDNGNAVYRNAEGNTVNGKYVADEDGSLKFVVDGETRFAFRLVMSDTGIASYEVRGDEYGLWFTVSQSGVASSTKRLILDGYGYATMVVYDRSTNSYQYCGGIYGLAADLDNIEDAYDGDEGTEVVVAIYNSSLYYRTYRYLLTQTTAQTSTGTTTVNVFAERVTGTVYGAPADGETLDHDTADKIVLSGYGILDDSATYTYKNESGATVTVTGKYVYDSVLGTITIIPATGDKLVFEIGTVGEGDDEEPVFTLQGVKCGKYGVTDLSIGNLSFAMAIYNNNIAAFTFMLPMSDQFFGTVDYSEIMLIVGEYERVIEGTTTAGDVYEFTATPNLSIINLLYNNYGVNIMPLYQLKFQFVYATADFDVVDHISVTKTGDYMGGFTFTYGGVEYTLDGYGTAVGTDGEGNELKATYSYNTQVGFGTLYVSMPGVKDELPFVDLDGDGNYVEFDSRYQLNNAYASGIQMMFFKDDTAVFMVVSQSVYYPVSYGNVTWSNEAHTAGTYTANLEFDPLVMTYPEFKFTIVTKTDADGKVTARYINIYELGTTEPNADGKYVITNAAGDELTLDIGDASAKYVKKGGEGENDTEYNGTFQYFDGNIRLIYGTNQAMTFELTYGADGVSFETVGNEIGYAVDYNDGISYMYLSGKSAGEEGVYSATYYVYDAETDAFTEYEGTYRISQYGVQGYDFNYTVDGVAHVFTFMPYSSSWGNMFRTYTDEVNFTIGYMSASNFGQPQAIGSITGGGYNPQVITLSQSRAYGTLTLYNAENEIFVFTTASGQELYFKRTSENVLFYLDGTYVPETNGEFELDKPIEVKIAGTPGSFGVPAVPEHTATITKVQMSGYAFAYMSYTYNGEEKTIEVAYVQIASSTFALVDYNNNQLVARIRLMVRTNEDDTLTYYAEVCDTDYYGMFLSNENTVISLDGFDSAVYVDGYGRVYSGSYTVDENGVVCIMYLDTYGYTVGRVYLTVDTEKGTFTVVPAPTDND